MVGMELFMGEMALIYHCRMPKIVSEESDKNFATIQVLCKLTNDLEN